MNFLLYISNKIYLQPVCRIFSIKNLVLPIFSFFFSQKATKSNSISTSIFVTNVTLKLRESVGKSTFFFFSKEKPLSATETTH